MPNAAHKIVRWQSPVAHLRRTAHCDTELGGPRITGGKKIIMWYIQPIAAKASCPTPRGSTPDARMTDGTSVSARASTDVKVLVGGNSVSHNDRGVSRGKLARGAAERAWPARSFTGSPRCEFGSRSTAEAVGRGRANGGRRGSGDRARFWRGCLSLALMTFAVREPRQRKWF